MHPLVAVLLLVASEKAYASHLQHFGFYADDLSATHTSSNLHQASSVSDAVAAHRLGQSSLLYVGGYLWSSQDHKMVLSPSASKSIAALRPLAAELLQNGTIIGFNLGDELLWNCLDPQNLTKGAQIIREAFPKGSAVIWYNEAAFFHSLPAKDSCGTPHADLKIPEELDWFSVDIYHMDGPVTGWVDEYVRTWYDSIIYPNLTSSQRVLLVPGAFGSDVNHYPNGTYVCDRECYDRMCAQDAADFVAWAQEDERVVGIMPWNWGGCPTCNGSRWTPAHTCCMDEIGLKDQPLARAAWLKFGAEIIHGTSALTLTV